MIMVVSSSVPATRGLRSFIPDVDTFSPPSLLCEAKDTASLFVFGSVGCVCGVAGGCVARAGVCLCLKKK